MAYITRQPLKAHPKRHRSYSPTRVHLLFYPLRLGDRPSLRIGLYNFTMRHFLELSREDMTAVAIQCLAKLTDTERLDILEQSRAKQTPVKTSAA